MKTDAGNDCQSPRESARAALGESHSSEEAIIRRITMKSTSAIGDASPESSEYKASVQASTHLSAAAASPRPMVCDGGSGKTMTSVR